MNKISSFFQRTREEGGSPSTSGRLYIDCLLGTTLIGWACSPKLEPTSAFMLAVAGQSAAIESRVFPRADVSQALGVSNALPLGFSLCLPVQLWDASGQLITSDLSLQAVGQNVPISAPHSVAELLHDLGRQQHHPEWSKAVTNLLQQLAQPTRPAWLTGEALAKCESMAQRIGWPQWPSAQAQACQGHLEENQGLVWRGWVLGPHVEDETLRLYVNGQELAAQAIRTDRADVAAAMNSTRRRLGFELELPGSIWHQAPQDGRITLELWAGALNLCPQRVDWTPAHLSQHLIQLYEAIGSKPEGTAARSGHADQQYELLLGLEHLLEADMLLVLPSIVRQWFMAQAERFGLGPHLAARTQAQQPLMHGPQHDLTTIELWDLLRRFNALVADDGHDASEVFAEMCRQRNWGDDTHHRFVCALIPYFCGIGRYEALRPWIPIGELKALASDKTAWSLSLMLPELVWTEHYALARRVMSRLAMTTNGWLNTECVAVAVRRVLSHWPLKPRARVQAAALVRATLALLDAQASSYWGRSHDVHLTQAAVDLVSFSRRFSANEASTTQTAVLRQMAFHPGFWQALKQTWPSTSAWPSEFQWAYSRFEDFESAVWEGDFSSRRWVSSLCGSVAQGCFDAALAWREMVLHAAATSPDGSDAMPQLPGLLSGLSPREVLRLAAHPLAQPAWLGQPSATAQLISGHASPRHAALREWRAGLLNALWSGQQTDQLDMATDLTLLSSADHGGIGVILSVLARAVRASSTSPISGLSDIRTRWTRLFDETVAHAVPPAALLQAWSLLVRWQEACPTASQLPRLIAECRHLACARYGAELASIVEGPAAPKQQALRAPDVLRTSLVVIYSCRKNLDGRVEQIKTSWGKRLDALGIPWIVAVGDGQGQLEGHLLQLPVPDGYEALPLKSLALIRWVYDHTDFTHLIKIDDDCHFAVDYFFDNSPHLAHHYLGRKLARSIGGTDRTWHQAKSMSPLAQRSIDKSPEPSEYADGGSGYCLSRFAMSALLKSLSSTAGARLTRSAYMEDKLVGDLLSLSGITVCEAGFETLVRRRFGADPICVNAYSNTFYPSLSSPTMVTHLDDASALGCVEDGMAEAWLRPAKLWPSYEAPQFTVDGSNQLELLSPLSAVDALKAANIIVVAVLRNERVLLPHFLDHYRKLGASRFIFVDNLSEDGSRAYLLSQPDVVLYSADTEYRKSHFGVAWQQAVLAAHAMGKWVILADLDEFLVYEGCEDRSLDQWVASLEQERVNAVTTLMVDMYPKGDLAGADFQHHPPFECAPYFDQTPLLTWRLGSGCFSNSLTCLSGLRHRLIEDSAPNLYTSQKVAIIKYQPWIRLSEGLHYASNVMTSSQRAFFAHFKYHAGFAQKVMTEITRKQHFNDAEEYQRYLTLIAEGSRTLWSKESLKFSHSTDYVHATLATIQTHATPGHLSV